MVLNPIVNVSEAPVGWILYLLIEAEVKVIYEVLPCERQLPSQNFVAASAQMLGITRHTIATLNTNKNIYTKLKIN